MTWLDRILATPCPLPSCGALAGDACDVERGMRPVRPADPSYFHASRIAAAEGAPTAGHFADRAYCNACAGRNYTGLVTVPRTCCAGCGEPFRVRP